MPCGAGHLRPIPGDPHAAEVTRTRRMGMPAGAPQRSMASSRRVIASCSASTSPVSTRCHDGRRPFVSKAPCMDAGACLSSTGAVVVSTCVIHGGVTSSQVAVGCTLYPTHWRLCLRTSWASRASGCADAPRRGGGDGERAELVRELRIRMSLRHTRLGHTRGLGVNGILGPWGSRHMGSPWGRVLYDRPCHRTPIATCQ